MPAGKLGALAGSVWSRRLDVAVVMRSTVSYGVSVRSLKPYRSATAAKKQPDAASIKVWRERLRTAFKRYLIDCGRFHSTATELRKSLTEIVRLARHFAASPTLDSASRFLDQLELNSNAETAVRRGLRISGANWVWFKREMRDLGSNERNQDVLAEAERCDRLALHVVLIGCLDARKLVPESGPWPDPALHHLVATVAPLWREVTGRSAAPLSDDWGKGDKRFLFADWIEEVHRLMEIEPPPRGRIQDCIRPSGPRRRPKKPPSVRRRKM